MRRLGAAILVAGLVGVPAAGAETRDELLARLARQAGLEVTPGLEELPPREAEPTTADFVLDEPEAPRPPDGPVVLELSEPVGELELPEIPPVPLEAGVTPALAPRAVATSSRAPALALGPRHVWFAGTSGPLRYGRGVLLRPGKTPLAPRLELRLQVAHRLASGEPSPVGFRIATNYLSWIAGYRLEVQRRGVRGWEPLFQREGPVRELLPVVGLQRAEVARLFCAGPQLRARLTVRDPSGARDRTGWLEFRIRPPTRTYEGVALVSSPAAQASLQPGGRIARVGARPAELWSLRRHPRGAWTEAHLEGTLLAEMLLPLKSVPPLHWSRGHLGAPATLDPVWYWEGDAAVALLAPPPALPRASSLPDSPAPRSWSSLAAFERARAARALETRRRARRHRARTGSTRPSGRRQVPPRPPSEPDTAGWKAPEGALPPWLSAGL